MNFSSNGFLLVRVTHSKHTYPVANATVSVFDSKSNFKTVAVTDQSGRTPVITLETPNTELSLNSGNSPENTAGYYSIKVTAEGFLETVIKEIPIYGNITSIQTVDLIYRASMPNGNEVNVITLPLPDL